jgi:hypothetical protein
VSLTRVAAQNGGPVYAHKPVFGALVLLPDPLAGQLSLGRADLDLAFQRRFSGVPACPDVMYADQLHDMSSINLSDSLSLPNGAEVGEGSKFVVNVADTGVVAFPLHASRSHTQTSDSRASTSQTGTPRRQGTSTTLKPSLPPPAPARRRLLRAVAAVAVVAAVP